MPKIYIGEKRASLRNGAGKPRYPHVEDLELDSKPLTLYQNKFKMDPKPYY
jgi:hypothetical protein